MDKEIQEFNKVITYLESDVIMLTHILYTTM